MLSSLLGLIIALFLRLIIRLLGFCFCFIYNFNLSEKANLDLFHTAAETGHTFICLRRMVVEGRSERVKGLGGDRVNEIVALFASGCEERM